MKPTFGNILEQEVSLQTCSNKSKCSERFRDKKKLHKNFQNRGL